MLSPFSWDKIDMRVDNFPLMDSLLWPFGMLLFVDAISDYGTRGQWPNRLVSNFTMKMTLDLNLETSFSLIYK